MSEDDQERRYGFAEMQTMMERLRDPADGCPWDLEQTPQTIINYSIEEVYELAEVIEESPLNYQELQDELGDVLLQVAFFAQFAREEGQFSLGDVVDHLCKKMIRRHPHVFPGGFLESRRENSPAIESHQVKQNWAAIKKIEKGEVDDFTPNLFDNIPVQLPALMLAGKIQKRATKIGLDWDDADAAAKKIEEEAAELTLALRERSMLKEAEAINSDDHIEEELGDLLFSVVNVARKLDKNPEQLLRSATRKFARRANFVAREIEEYSDQSDAKGGGTADPDLLDRIWEKSKIALKT